MNTDNDETGIRKALVLDAQSQGHDDAEALYRSVAAFRDALPDSAKKQLAAAFEWAREGINSRSPADRAPELDALASAYTYARDVLIASVGSEKK